MGKENLKPMNQRTKEEQRKIAKMGGIASGKARQEKKKLREELEALLEVIDSQGNSVQKKMSYAIIRKAVEGDVRAFEVIRDTIGQKPKETVELTQSIDESIKEIDEYLCEKEKDNS